MNNPAEQDFYITLPMSNPDNAEALIARVRASLDANKLQNTLEDSDVHHPMGGASELIVHIKLATEIIQAVGGAAAATAALLVALKQCRDAANDLLSKNAQVCVEHGDQGNQPIDEIDATSLTSR